MNAHPIKPFTGQPIAPNSLPLRHAAYALVVPTLGPHKGLILVGTARERGNLSDQYVFPGGKLEYHELQQNTAEHALDEQEGFRTAVKREYWEETNGSRLELVQQTPIASFKIEAYQGDINVKLFLGDLENPYLLPETSKEISGWYFFRLEQLINNDRTSIGVKDALRKVDFTQIPHLIT